MFTCMQVELEMDWAEWRRQEVQEGTPEHELPEEEGMRVCVMALSPDLLQQEPECGMEETVWRVVDALFPSSKDMGGHSHCPDSTN